MAIWLVPQGTTAELNAATVTAPGDLAYDNQRNVLVVSNGQGIGEDVYQDVTPETITATVAGSNANTVIVGTGTEGALATLEIAEGELLGRITGGQATSQKLDDSMINDNTISHSKLANVRPGHVLGVASSLTPNAAAATVTELSIDSLRGSSITSSVTEPTNPADNDLWYYCGAQDGDNARLYIRQEGLWVDASPAIVNTNPGAQGPAGAAGAEGQGIEAVVAREISGGDSLILDFYNDGTARASSNLISTVNIPLADLRSATSLPTAPIDNGSYNLTRNGSTLSWESSEFDRTTYKVNLPAGGNTAALITPALLVRSSPIPDSILITYSGFVLEEDIDYTVSGGNVTILADTAELIGVQASQQIEIIVFEDT